MNNLKQQIKAMETTNRNKKKLHLMVFILFFVIVSCDNSNQYQITIIDDLSGEELAARVSVTDLCGKPIHIDGNRTHVEYLGKHWCYTEGSFSFTSPVQGITLEIQRGPETLPVKLSLKKGRKKQIIKLHRWINMQQQGYMNGDIHIHTPF